LTNIILEAESKSYKVKAIGAGHSSSDIALTRDFMIDTYGLNRVLDISLLHLREDIGDTDHLFFVEAGIQIRQLNKELDVRHKALVNMGAYDGQTLGGVISTSTHGSTRWKGPAANRSR
jgi:FAD/FMN-containing dehydrogenase